MTQLNVCVLGAGVVGLTTAIELQTEFRDAKVNLIAEEFYDKTTSFVAPGLFYPGTTFSGPTESITDSWFNSSFIYWNNLFKNYPSSTVGVKEISGYNLSQSNADCVRNRHIEALLPGFRLLLEDELAAFPGDWKYGSFMNTLLMENGRYLKWAANKFLNGLGKIIQQKIESFEELVGKYDVVINCTGVGARFLCNDTKVIPIRGQIYKVHAPWIDKFYFLNDVTEIFPGFEGVTLGTTRQYERFDREWSVEDELDIKRRCESLLPSLKNAKVIARRVGLRPHRSPVRVEYELMSFDKGSLKVVHNYGHSSNGVTAAPGTAKHAIQLVREALKSDYSEHI